MRRWLLPRTQVPGAPQVGRFDGPVVAARVMDLFFVCALIRDGHSQTVSCGTRVSSGPFLSLGVLDIFGFENIVGLTVGHHFDAKYVDFLKARRTVVAR